MNDFLDKIVVVIPGLVGILYLLVAIAYLFDKNVAWFLVWFGYALANVGLIMASIK